MDAPKAGEITPDGRRIIKVVPIQWFMVVVTNEKGEEERLFEMNTCDSCDEVGS